MYRSVLIYIFISFLLSFLLSNVKASLENEALVGGNVDTTNQIKHTISLQANRRHVCGAAIIKPKLILTAAHCFIGSGNAFFNRRYDVVAGITNLLAHNSNRIENKVIAAYVPREYNWIDPQLTGSDPSIADIAVAKLEHSFSTYGNILSLPQKHFRTNKYPTYEGLKAIISGFGFEAMSIRRNPENNRNEALPTIMNSRLKYADAMVLTNNECSNIFRGKPVSESHLCARVVQRIPRKEESVCVGDTGGPLVIDKTVIGIASIYPEGCSEKYFPTIYTRVSSFLPFIWEAQSYHDEIDALSNIRYKNYENYY